MKIFKKILGIITLLVVLVFILRIYNEKKYGNKSLKIYGYYSNVTDIDQYPKNIEGVDVKYVDEGAFQGFHLIPNKKLHKGIVICYGGSEGSPNFDNAKRLAKEGYETLAVFMFGMKNQPKNLVRIPLEQFEDVLKYISYKEDSKPITVFGVSKGAEYALNLAARYKEIENLILFAPSSYTFAGLDFKNYGSSWTYKNKELPFIDINKSTFLPLFKDMIIPLIIKSPVRYKGIYDVAIKIDNDKNLKLIPTKDIKANILIIAGEDDQMWGSYEMAKIIKSNTKNVTIASYENAGHIFAGNGIVDTNAFRINTGGNSEANNRARIDSDRVIDEFLKKFH